MFNSFNNVYSLIMGKIENWIELGIKSVPNMVAALTIVAIFHLLGRLAQKISLKVVPKVSESKSITNLVASLSYLLILTAGIFISLGILNLDKTVTSLLAGAGVIGLALGFAFQEIASNFISGILIAFMKPYQINDIVEVGGNTGQVIKIQLRTTSLMTFQGLEVLIPNKDMFTKPFTNFTTTPRRRIDLEVGVSYSDNLRKVKELVLSTLEKLDERISNEPIKVFFTEFGNSSINFVAQIWVKYPGHQTFLNARSEAIMGIKEAFDKEGITIPFPIRTLDFPKKLEIDQSSTKNGSVESLGLSSNENLS